MDGCKHGGMELISKLELGLAEVGTCSFVALQFTAISFVFSLSFVALAVATSWNLDLLNYLLSICHELFNLCMNYEV